MLLCDISQQLLSRVSITELMRTRRNLGTLVLKEDNRAHDKIQRAQTREVLSVSFEQNFIFVLILICFNLIIFLSEPLVIPILVFLCVCVCYIFCFCLVGCHFVLWLWCYPLVCPWLCSIDPRIAVLCHG